MLYNTVISECICRKENDMEKEIEKETKTKTLEKIQEAAQKEFLEKGFQAASLRNIVKNAGVTTGAFYGYYKSKEELFDALVSEQYEHIMKMYIDAQNGFKKLDARTQQKSMGEVSRDCMEEMLDYMYDNEIAFRLILTCSQGTRYENIIHEVSEIEVQSTHDFMQTLESSGMQVKHIDPMLEHMLVSGMFSAFFELLIHRNDIKEAKTYLGQLRAFYTAGWINVFDIRS